MQAVDIHKAARAFFLKSSIPDIHKRGRHCSYGTTIAVKTKPKPNTYYKTPTMRVEGGWVGVRTRSGRRPAPPSDLFLTNVPSRAAHTERGNGTLGRRRGAEARRVLRCGYGSYCFLRRNLPTSRLAASLGFACA